MTPDELSAGLERWAAALQAAASELNALDGRLGDGDLGTTLDKCASNVRESMHSAPQGFVAIFKACAAACAKASGSSFGTLLAVAFLTASKTVGDVKVLGRSDLAGLLHGVVSALSARGGASLGDKTMLDGIEAVALALDASSDGSDLRAASVDGARGALEAFRSRPNKIGRARMFAEKSIGMDDPGMVAVLRMVQAL